VVGSATEEIAVTWSPALDLAGKRYLLTASRTSVGRDAGADIQIDDSGLSRKHFEILWDGSKAGIRDLGSTNGTKVDGRAMSESPLQNESRISAGRSEFIFRIVANKVSNE
jgi:pSer/pThr/pTyr-binding forkhead associated (FHA) protein